MPSDGDTAGGQSSVTSRASGKGLHQGEDRGSGIGDNYFLYDSF